MILVLETGYVFGWLVAMVLNLIVPHETGDPMERIRAARKAKGLVVPLSEEEGRAIEENQIHNPKMGFEGDSAHPTPVVVPVSLAVCQSSSTCAAAWLSHVIVLWRESAQLRFICKVLYGFLHKQSGCNNPSDWQSQPG